MFVKKGLHDQERQRMQDKDHKPYVKVVKPGGQHHAVQSPHCRGNTDRDGAYNDLLVLH